MKKAYLETIRDFELALSYAGFFEFKRKRWLRQQIEVYENKLSEL